MKTDLSRLISSLNNSKLRRGKPDEQDPALYQVIFTLIKELQANEAIQGIATPTPHAFTHYAAGSDPVDILQLSGYLGGVTKFLREDGTWVVNTGSGISELTGDVTAGPGTGSVAATIANNAVVTAKVADGAITYAKIQDVSAASRLLGRGSAAGAGDVQEIVLGANLALTGTTLDATSTTGTVQFSGDVVAGPGSGLLVSTIQNNVVSFAKFQTIAESRLVGRGQGSGAGNTQELVLGTNLSITGTILSAASGAGVLVDYAVFQTGAVATGTTVIPLDNSIPQNTEGTQFLSLVYAPNNAANILEVTAILFLEHGTMNRWLTTALFRDTTADALAVGFQPYITVANAGGFVTVYHTMVAGTTSTTTFSVRSGADLAGTVTFNGSAGAGLYGGRLSSCIIVKEFTP